MHLPADLRIRARARASASWPGNLATPSATSWYQRLEAQEGITAPHHQPDNTMTPIHTLADLAVRRRNRTRIVILARKPRHACAVLRAIGMPSQPVTAAPADARATWTHHLWGYPPPLLWIDPDLQPEQVSGADLVLLVEPARRRGEPLPMRVLGRPVNRLFTLLRAAAEADGWQ